MKIIKATTKDALSNIENLYMSAFPEAERKPWALLLKKQEEGLMELFALESEDGSFLGLAIMAYDKDLVLLDYFAVFNEKRGQGIGSSAIRALQEMFAGKRFVLEIESTKYPSADSELRKSRKAFYLRNGLHTMNFDVNLFGVEMEVLSNCEELHYKEYLDIYLNTCGPQYANKISMIQEG